MQDFNEYAKNSENFSGCNTDGVDPNIIDMVTSLASRFDGKSQNELLMAIYEEARKGKMRGTLSNQDIDNFARMLSPMLDEQKRKLLNKVVKELKKI